MNDKDGQRYLNVFLEVSNIQIDSKNRAIKKKMRIKKFSDTSLQSKLNIEIEKLLEEKLVLVGHMDAVKLEMLDMILDNPSLISEKLLKKKECSSVVEFVEREKSMIEFRGLYKKYPFSIKEVFNVALSGSEENRYKVVTDRDVINAVDRKNAKFLIKTSKLVP